MSAIMERRPLPVGKTWHVFFLYRTEDPSRASIIELIEQLQASGYVCGNHETDFTIGNTFLCNLEKSIKGSQVIIPWISKEFLQSPFCMKDLEIACHFYDEGIKVMPLLYNLKRKQIPDILKQLVCLDISDGKCTWVDRIIQSVHRHIFPASTDMITPNQEANSLFQKFEAMSAQAKILFAQKFSTTILFNIPSLMHSLSEKELMNIFDLHVSENKECFHMASTYLPSGVLERECVNCILFSFNSTLLGSLLYDHSNIVVLSRTCATSLGNVVGCTKAYKKFCAVFEYLLSDSVDFPHEHVYHLCFENNYFVKGPRLQMLKVSSIGVYDKSSKLIRRSCIDLVHV